MARRKLGLEDAAERAARDLGAELLRRGVTLEGTAVKRVPVNEALHGARAYEVASRRDTLRVLFVSQETELLNPLQQSLDGFLDLSDLFAEVHILILRQGIAPKHPTLRVRDNVWLYTAAAKHWWQLPRAGERVLAQELAFAGGFRPDLLIARDPYEAAVTTLRVARRYERPAQLHVLSDRHRVETAPAPGRTHWHRFALRYTVPRFLSVRTDTATLAAQLAERYNIPDLAPLPQYQSYDALTKAKATTREDDVTSPFTVTMVYVGHDFTTSAWFRVLDAARYALRNRRIGLYVLGPAAAQKSVEARAKLLGIEAQVRFVPQQQAEDLVPYLKVADLFLMPDIDSESEDYVLQAAAVGVPLVIAATPLRRERFKAGVAAEHFPPEDTQAFTDRIDDLLNNVSYRRALAAAAQEVICTDFHGDKAAYREAYQTSIEQALFVGEVAEAAEEAEATEAGN